MAAPTPLESFSEAVVLGIKRRMLWSLVPWYLLVCVSVPNYVVWHWYAEAAPLLRQRETLAVMSGVMVVGGLLSSVCVNLMREVFSLVSEQSFAKYLRKLGLFNQYIFWPQFTLFMQLFLMIYCVLVIAVFAIVPTAYLLPYLVATSFGGLIYVTTKTYNLVGMVRILVWHRQEYRENQSEP